MPFLIASIRGLAASAGEMFTGWTTVGAADLHRKPRLSTDRPQLSLVPCSRPCGTFIPDPLTFPKPAPSMPPRLISEAEMGRVLSRSATAAHADQPAARRDYPLGVDPVVLLRAAARRTAALEAGRHRGRADGAPDSFDQVLQVQASTPLPHGDRSNCSTIFSSEAARNCRWRQTAFLMWSGHGGSEVYGATNLSHGVAATVP